MEFKKIQLNGFKSFSEKNLLIERGLTGIVGPNGCKSNIVESLRWCMKRPQQKV